jgi:WD40 repeat protein
MEHLRSVRVLVVLDNVESALEEHELSGRIRPSFEGFGRFLHKCAETRHQSSILLTSRQKPVDLLPYEGGQTPVRTLRMVALDTAACEHLLAERRVVGSPSEQSRLIEAYAGNPLALKIVAQTIVDLFGGQIEPFLEQGGVVFGGIQDLLHEQYKRLSPIERRFVFWLAIMREPMTIHQLQSLFVVPLPPATAMEIMNGLYRHSLIERGQISGSFTLQSVVMEYLTGQLITEAYDEILRGDLTFLIQLGLEQAQVTDYVRQAQTRLLIAPLLVRLQSMGQLDLEAHFNTLLDTLRESLPDAQGYAPANLIALFRELRGNLKGLDLSGLTLRGVYLQGVDMQDTKLTESTLLESIFSATFDTIIAIAVSPTGEYWAGSSRSGEVWLWETSGHTLYRTWQAHAELVWTLAFSPDGKMLVSGGWDRMIKLWDVPSGELLWSGSHSSHINGLAFSSDGRMVASSGGKETILWDVQRTEPVESLPSPCTVISVAWSPDGQLIATGDIVGNIRLWEIDKTRPAVCIHTFSEHTQLVSGLDFSPDGGALASGSYDGTVKLWEIASRRLSQTLEGLTERVQRIAWSPDGKILASSGFEKMILLWEVEQNRYRAALQGHPDMVIGLAFTPDGRNLLSSGGGMLRVWDLESSRCLHVMKGNAISILDIDWSPDSVQLVSGGADAAVIIWDIDHATPSQILRGHHRIVCGVSWRSDGQQLATSSWDSSIRLWDANTGIVVQALQGTDIVGNMLYGLAWSPDGERLASGSFMRGAQTFEAMTSQRRWASDQFPIWIRRVAWSPNGAMLAGGGEDGVVYVWDDEGLLLQRLIQHQGTVTSVAWSPDGAMLASASGGAYGELFIWDVKYGQCVGSFTGHPKLVTAIDWSPRGNLLISGDSDGVLRWWDIQRGECVWMHEAHQGTVQSLRVSPDGMKLASCGNDGAIILWDMDTGNLLKTLRQDRPYERMDITGIRGLTEAQKVILCALGATENNSPAVQLR